LKAADERLLITDGRHIFKFFKRSFSNKNKKIVFLFFICPRKKTLAASAKWQNRNYIHDEKRNYIGLPKMEESCIIVSSHKTKEDCK